MSEYVCGGLFAQFTFLFLYVRRADQMAVAQHVLSQGRTHYSPLWAALVLTLLLSILPFVIRFCIRLPHKAQALAFLPSALFLGMLTAVKPDILEYGVQWGNWAWGLPLLLVVYVFALKGVKQFPERLHDKKTPFAYLWPNLCILTLLIAGVGCISSGNDVFEYEQRMIRLLEEERYEDALDVGKNADATSCRLTALRAFALCQTKRLPNDLFTYAIVSGSKSILPVPKDSLMADGGYKAVFRQFGYKPGKALENNPLVFLDYLARHTRCRKATVDYLLCAQLMDKDLEGFIKTLSYYYEVNEFLPTAYKEALVLYDGLNEDSVLGTDSVMQARYDKFMDLYRAEIPLDQRRQNCSRFYKGTYWFFYYFL